MPSAFLPIAALIRRELVSSLRERKFYALLAVLVFLAATFVLLSYPDRTLTPLLLSMVSRGMFVFVIHFLAIGALVVIPATSGSAIVSEREEGTLDLLAMTSAKPWHVVTAKLANSVGHYLLIIIALMPIAAASYFLVGLDNDLLWNVLFLISATTLSCAAAGVMCSCLFKRPAVAVGTSYLCMLTILGLPMLLLLVVLALFDIFRLQDSMDWFAQYVSPYIAFSQMTSYPNYRPSIVNPMSVASACGSFHSALAIALIILTHQLVARRWGKSESPERRRTKLTKVGPVRGSGRVRVFSTRANPVYLKEVWFEMSVRKRTGLLTFVTPFLLAFSATTLIVLCRYVNADEYSYADAFAGWQLLQAVLMPALLVAVMGNIFTKEHERDTFDCIRVTTLGPEKVFTGKMHASIQVALTIVFAAALGSIPLLFLPQISKITIVLGFLMLAECMLIAWACALFASSMHRKMTWAFVTAYVSSAMFIVGIAAVAAAILSWLRVTDSRGMDRVVYCISPLSAFLSRISVGYMGVQPGNTEGAVIEALALAYPAMVALVSAALSYLGFLTTYRKSPTLRPLVKHLSVRMTPGQPSSLGQAPSSNP
ncbi:MAG: ABC transporter permease [Candidatus Hydrogenedentes bacterium]|nr:ABC transporter permease [Candidatus Hydrogenedentota bacterium]